ncbi:MAG: aminopeptidase P family protein [Clostridia bacterium]|nr:aminopeptidase P family protein [Clostridia bacterium]
MRITTLLSKIPKGEYVLLSSPEDMRYFSGFSGEGYVLISDSDRIIYTDGRYTEQAEKETDGFSVRNIRNMKKELEGITNSIYFQEHKMNYSDYAGLSKTVDLKPSQIAFQTLRSVKDEDEIESLKKAAQIAEISFENTLSFISAGKTEQEIAAYLNYQMAINGGEKPSFDTICISGTNTSLPHGRPTAKKVNEGEFLTLDFGCVYNGYCSDMTRTVAIGYLSDEMELVYDIVLAAQDKTEKALKPGMTGHQGDEIARKIIVDAGYGEYFVHSTGHGVGLEIHEQPTLAPNKDCILKEGQLVTVEPGIYLPKKFGVRIENTVLLTKSGSEPLQKCEKELIIL